MTIVAGMESANFMDDEHVQHLAEDKIAQLEFERTEMSVALRVIASLPIEQQDDFMAANMRKIARDCLTRLQIET